MSRKMKKCGSCSSEIASNAKACPNCGAKCKKPFFKKWWFWLAIIIVFVLLISSTGDDSDSKTNVGATTAPYVDEDVSETEKETESIILTTESASSKETIGQKNARRSAESYLRVSAFSRDGLIEQLEYEQYSHDDAVYAVDNCGADWMEQALKSAKSYLNVSAFSYEGLIEQLEYEGYTAEQAKYGADNCGADWNEQAAKSAESYLSFSSFSKNELIEQLEFEGFSYEQALYGVQANGY